ncbi:MAG TPA: hypothetical protein VEN30_06940 [Paraburkholderia sp.]|nr:hypothetical protein [Paraburkholderia sp.]
MNDDAGKRTAARRSSIEARGLETARRASITDRGVDMTWRANGAPAQILRFIFTKG